MSTSEYERTLAAHARWWRLLYGPFSDRDPHVGYHLYWESCRALAAGWRSVFGPKGGPA